MKLPDTSVPDRARDVEQPHLLVLEGDCDIRNARSVAALLREALAMHGSVVVVTRDMSSADTSTVQTLLAAHGQANSEGKSFVLQQPLGAALADFVKAAGLTCGHPSPSDTAPRSSHVFGARA